MPFGQILGKSLFFRRGSDRTSTPFPPVFGLAFFPTATQTSIIDSWAHYVQGRPARPGFQGPRPDECMWELPFINGEFNLLQKWTQNLEEAGCQTYANLQGCGPTWRTPWEGGIPTCPHPDDMGELEEEGTSIHCCDICGCTSSLLSATTSTSHQAWASGWRRSQIVPYSATSGRLVPRLRHWIAQRTSSSSVRHVGVLGGTPGWSASWNVVRPTRWLQNIQNS